MTNQQYGCPLPSPYRIIGGSAISGDSHSAARRNFYVSKGSIPLEKKKDVILLKQKKIVFPAHDREDVIYPHHDELVITAQIATKTFDRVIIDDGSALNLISTETLRVLQITSKEAIRGTSFLSGFSGHKEPILGKIDLPIHIWKNETVHNFYIVNNLPGCDVILGRTWIKDMKAVPSSYHQCVQIPVLEGVIQVNGHQTKAKSCYMKMMQPAIKVHSIPQHIPKADQATTQTEEIKEVVLDKSKPEEKIRLGTDIPKELEEDLLEFLKKNKKTFAWKHEDMTGIDKNIITHKLNVDPTYRPVHQKRRKFAP